MAGEDGDASFEATLKVLDDYFGLIDIATPGRSQRPDYAFSVEQLSDCKELRCALVTLVIDGVSVPDILIDLGASCNIVGQ